MALGYRLRVDWDGDSTFGHSLADVTDDLVKSIVAKRGREYASQVYGRSVAGRLKATLRNDHERYSNLSQESDLRGLVLPRRKVEFATRENSTAEWSPLWTGYVEQLEPIEQRSGADEITIDAVGISSELTDRLVTSQMNENIRCDDAAEIILENAGIPDEDIGTLDAPRVIPRWWAGHQPAIEALRQIEETEGGVLFEDGDGRIRLDRAYARIVGSRRNEVAIFSDAHMQNSTGIATLKLREPAQDIANIVRVRVRRYSTGAEATLWELADPILLNSGASTTIVAEYESGVAAWTTPLVSTTDYTANAEEGGTGTDMTSDLGVSTEERGSELQITLTNNHATDALYVLTLAPRGQALTEGQPLIVLEKDQDSIDDYGARDYLVASRYLGTYSDALDYARYILALLAQPQQRAKLSFFADSNETLARTLNVGDRVSLIARGVATSMFVESIEHRLERGGIHMLTLLLSPADVYASTIVLDVGPGLNAGIIGR